VTALPATPAARLARALLVQAVRSLPRLADAARADALLALDAFVTDPRPSVFLAARRALSSAARDRAARAAAPRRFDLGLEALADAGLDAATLESLATLPRDAPTAARLAALGALALARHELSARSAAAAAALRARLGETRRR
jgi:hypothetical protein